MYKKGLLSLVALLNITLLYGVVPLDSSRYSFDLKRAFNKKNVIPIAIIGSGPAGLTAAMYGKRLGYPTTVFTGPLIGGQLTETTLIENWPGVKKTEGYTVMQILQEQVEEVGAVIVEDTIVSVDFGQWPFVLHTESKLTLHALSVIIATGAAPRKLGIPGELEYWGKGVTACSVCDCVFFKDKDVVVVGGGDSAVEEATQLSHYARSVTVLVRKDRMRAVPIMQDKLEDYKNVKIVYNKQVLKVLGDKAKVTGLEVLNTDTQRVETLKTDGLFLAIGRNPNTDLFKPYLKLTRNGYIDLETRSQVTSVAGVYAAGDAQDSEFRQAVVAAGDACKAAFEAAQWLHKIGLTDLAIKRHASSFFDSKTYKENLSN